MPREAKLYILSDKDWKPLADLIENHKDCMIKQQITIYQLMTSTSSGEHYAILTLSISAEKIVEDYGASAVKENDYLKTTLHDYHGDTLYGDKTNIVFLNKIS